MFCESIKTLAHGHPIISVQKLAPTLFHGHKTKSFPLLRTPTNVFVCNIHEIKQRVVTRAKKNAGDVFSVKPKWTELG